MTTVYQICLFFSRHLILFFLVYGLWPISCNLFVKEYTNSLAYFSLCHLTQRRVWNKVMLSLLASRKNQSSISQYANFASHHTQGLTHILFRVIHPHLSPRPYSNHIFREISHQSQFWSSHTDPHQQKFPLQLPTSNLYPQNHTTPHNPHQIKTEPRKTTPKQSL